MDPSNGDALPRLLAPRPLFMGEIERQDYEDTWRFLQERREQGIQEQKIYCRFYNISNRDVDAIWCRGETQEDYIYGTIPPRRYFEILTFEGHPWIFRATEDGERMEILATGQRVHYPCKTTSKMISTSNGPVKLQVVLIRSQNTKNTSLKHLCIRQISRLFPTDYVSKLQFPAALLSEILEYYINKISYVHALCPTEQVLPEKEPAAKTVEYLKKLLGDLESQNCDLDLREKLRENMRLFTKIISNPSNSTDTDRPSTSGLNSSIDGAGRKRLLDESDVASQSKLDNQIQDTPVPKKSPKPL